MTLRVRCPSCGVKLKIRESKLGKRVLCPGCKGEIPVTNETIVKDRDDAAIEEELQVVRERSRSEQRRRRDRSKEKSKTAERRAKREVSKAVSRKTNEPSKTVKREKANSKTVKRETAANVVESDPVKPARKNQETVSQIDPNAAWESEASADNASALDSRNIELPSSEFEVLSYERWLMTLMNGPRDLFAGLLMLLSIPSAFVCMVTFMKALPEGSYPQILLIAPGLLAVFLMSFPFYGVYYFANSLANKKPEMSGKLRMGAALALVVSCVLFYGGTYFYATAEARAQRAKAQQERAALNKLSEVFGPQMSEYQALYDNLSEGTLINGKPRGGPTVVIEVHAERRPKISKATLYLGANQANQARGVVNLVCLNFKKKRSHFTNGSNSTTQYCEIKVIDYQRRALVAKSTIQGSITKESSLGEQYVVDIDNVIATIQSLIPPK